MYGSHIATNLAAYVFELGSFIFMYIGARCIAGELDAPEALKKFLGITNKMFLFFLLLFAALILLRNLGFNELTSFFFMTGNRFKGFFNFTNQLSIFFICLWPFAMLDCADKPVARFFFYGIYLVVLTYIGSRSGFWIGLAQTVLIEIFIGQRQRLWTLAVSLAALGAIVFLTITLMATEPSLQRSMGEERYATLELDEARLINFRQAFNASENWLLGYGLGCFDQNHRHEVHNTPFSVLVETGVLGFISFALFIIVIGIGVFRALPLSSVPNLKAALYISLLGMFGVGMFIYLLRNRSCWLVFAIALTLVKRQKTIAEKADA
jgi:hypothetical protein